MAFSVPPTCCAYLANQDSLTDCISLDVVSLPVVSDACTAILIISSGSFDVFTNDKAVLTSVPIVLFIIVIAAICLSVRLLVSAPALCNSETIDFVSSLLTFMPILESASFALSPFSKLSFI